MRMEEPETTFVALVEKSSKKLVGFTYAHPYPSEADIDLSYEQAEIQKLGLTPTEYQARQVRTAMVGYTMIKEANRSQGGWSHIMTALETNLKGSGKYDELTRVARQEGDYAAKIQRRYSGRIITQIPHFPSSVGPQTYFRTRL
jgi:hypothetical protein